MQQQRTPQLPVIFIGHGSPMNALARSLSENHFTRALRQLSSSFPKPQAIVVCSAHWETNGVHISAAASPETIYDFYGFPKELYQIKYPCPGSPELAQQVSTLLAPRPVTLDQKRGLDHGAWSVLLHLYPEANIPVIQVSIDKTLGPDEVAAIGASLKPLREKGVLLLGSGNIVHNLSLLSPD